MNEGTVKHDGTRLPQLKKVCKIYGTRKTSWRLASGTTSSLPHVNKLFLCKAHNIDNCKLKRKEIKVEVHSLTTIHTKWSA